MSFGREERRRLERAQRRLDTSHPRTQIAADRARLQNLNTRLANAQRGQLDRTRARWRRVGAQLDALSPLRVLERGYAVAQDSRGRAVRSAASLEVGDELSLRFSKGRAEVEVREVHEEE